MKALYYPLMALSLGLAGCAQLESTFSQGFLSSPPETLRSANQWNQIAADIAKRLQMALLSPDQTQSTMVLYVKRPPEGTFNAVFHQMLTTQLLEHGFGITDLPGAGLTVSYTTEVIEFGRFVPPNRLEPPTRQMVVTVAVTSADRYITRITDTYNISEYDVGLYLSQVVAPRRMEVVGK
jgi:hypothetical protein